MWNKSGSQPDSIGKKFLGFFSSLKKEMWKACLFLMDCKKKCKHNWCKEIWEKKVFKKIKEKWTIVERWMKSKFAQEV